MNQEELINIQGGGINATMINAIARGITSMYELGRSIGSAIRRIGKKSICRV